MRLPSSGKELKFWYIYEYFLFEYHTIVVLLEASGTMITNSHCGINEAHGYGEGKEKGTD